MVVLSEDSHFHYRLNSCVLDCPAIKVPVGDQTDRGKGNGEKVRQDVVKRQNAPAETGSEMWVLEKESHEGVSSFFS